MVGTCSLVNTNAFVLLVITIEILPHYVWSPLSLRPNYITYLFKTLKCTASYSPLERNGSATQKAQSSVYETHN